MVSQTNSYSQQEVFTVSGIEIFPIQWTLVNCPQPMITALIHFLRTLHKTTLLMVFLQTLSMLKIGIWTTMKPMIIKKLTWCPLVALVSWFSCFRLVNIHKITSMKDMRKLCNIACNILLDSQLWFRDGPSAGTNADMVTKRSMRSKMLFKVTVIRLHHLTPSGTTSITWMITRTSLMIQWLSKTLEISSDNYIVKRINITSQLSMLVFPRGIISTTKHTMRVSLRMSLSRLTLAWMSHLLDRYGQQMQSTQTSLRTRQLNGGRSKLVTSMNRFR